MSRPFPFPGRRWPWLALALALLGACPLSARNAIRWNALTAPAAGSVGQVITLTASVTNTGDAPWGSNHHLELTDQEGNRLHFAGLGPTAPGGTKTAAFEIRLPETVGTSTYHLAALQHGVEYFGPPVNRTVVVRDRPLEVTLTVERTTLVVGQRTVVHSGVGPEGSIEVHGLEGRPVGGRWETWVEWEGEGGGQQSASASPAVPGIYEIRAFAAREEDDDLTYSNRVLLVVGATAPDILRQPTDVVANVLETVELTVTGAGSTFTYVWRKDGVAIPGATGATLRLAPAHVAQSGRYTVTLSNLAGTVTSRAALVSINPLRLPALEIEGTNFPAAGGRRPVGPGGAVVGDVLSLRSAAEITAGTGWRHNVLVRRPAITAATALAPEDGSGFTAAAAAWNKDGWGRPHAAAGSYDPRVTGQPAVDLGQREPFLHELATGQAGSNRALDLVLDAPGEWLLRAEIVDGANQLIAVSATETVPVSPPAFAVDPAGITHPYGRSDRFVGVFWNAGQAHRLWSSWRAVYPDEHPATWATNWALMWQPSPYFRSASGGWLRPNPPADSPWRSFWSGHQVYALVPDAGVGGRLSHDLTSQAFAERAAVRLMDVGVDFVAVDYTNQFLEEDEAVLPALHNLALGFQAVAGRSQSGQRIKLTAVVPANVESGDWAGNGGFASLGIGRFNLKLTQLHQRYARHEAAWFHLEDDNGVRKPLLLLWVGASGEDDVDGRLSAGKLARLGLADGRPLTEVFTVRWVGAYLSENRRFLTGGSYAVAGPDGPVTGRHANAKFWSYHESFPAAATIAPGATGNSPAIEAVTVQPVARGRDRFGQPWDENWPANQGFHYETPGPAAGSVLAGYGRVWREALTVARALNPRFLLTTWAEFGSENDEPRPELSVTVMDNNKFGTHFGDALRQAVRLFKYRAPAAWVDTYEVAGGMRWLKDEPESVPPVLRADQTLRLQGWVSPNVATTFAGGSVRVFVDDQVVGNAVVGGAWNTATRWYFDLAGRSLAAGPHVVKVQVEDGVGGAALAGVQFRAGAPRNVLTISVAPAGGP